MSRTHGEFPFMGRQDEIVAESVKLAHEKAHHEGLKIGQTVTHENEYNPFANTEFILRSIEGDTATISMTTDDGQELVRHYPLQELFDPTEAGKHITDLQKTWPKSPETIH